MAHVSTILRRPMKSGLLEGGIIQGQASIGADGAPTVDTQSDPGVTIVRSDTGDYTLTCPKAGVLRPPKLSIVSSNIVTVLISAFDAAAGTAAITCYSDAGTTPADPASGSVLYVEWTVAKNAKG